jgi:hypothetical protein
MRAVKKKQLTLRVERQSTAQRAFLPSNESLLMAENPGEKHRCIHTYMPEDLREIDTVRPFTLVTLLLAPTLLVSEPAKRLEHLRVKAEIPVNIDAPGGDSLNIPLANETAIATVRFVALECGISGPSRVPQWHTSLLVQRYKERNTTDFLSC